MGTVTKFGLVLLMVGCIPLIEGNKSCLAVADRTWLAPCPNSTDYLQLFQNPNQWASARNATTVFQFFAQHLLPSPCSICGPNTLHNLIAAQAFQKLAQFGTVISVETGSIKEFDCDGTNGDTLNTATATYQNLAANGGSLWGLQMDEPLNSAIFSCQKSLHDASVGVARWIQAVKNATSSSLLIGDVEPYPQFAATELCVWVQTLSSDLSSRGLTLAWFHLDVDFNRVDSTTILGDIATIKGCCDQLHIPFGGIINAFPVTSDEEYRLLSLEHLTTYQKSVGRLSDVIFESWDVANSNPNGGGGFPINLPESDPNSMTGLMCAACGLSP